MDLRIELYERLHKKGLPVKFMAYWNENWIRRILSMPKGIDREKEIEEGLASFISCYQDVLEGKNVRLQPFFGDAIPESDETKALFAEMALVPDEEFNTSAKQQYFKDKYWALVEAYRTANPSDKTTPTYLG